MAQMLVSSAIKKNIKNCHQKKQTSAEMHYIGGNINFYQNQAFPNFRQHQSIKAKQNPKQ